MDMWNRLYGPEAFNPQMRPVSGYTAETLVNNRASGEIATDQPAAAPSARPAASNADKKKKMESRMKRLGY
jgi:hypothetical protein